MRKVTICRLRESDAGTEGVLVTDQGFTCKTLELPWRDNRRQRSCIPPGVYKVGMCRSPRFGKAYRLAGTAPRSAVLIHSGNYAGDVEKGLRSHVQGCILLGQKFGKIDGQSAILISRPTVREFVAHMGGQEFELVIEDMTC